MENNKTSENLQENKNKKRLRILKKKVNDLLVGISEEHNIDVDGLNEEFNSRIDEIYGEQKK